MTGYIYNAGGQRVWKLRGDMETMTGNGDIEYSQCSLNDKVLYASPYLVADEQVYTKHYFAESQRICSKLGGGFAIADKPVDEEIENPIGGTTYEEQANELLEMLNRGFECTGLDMEFAVIESNETLGGIEEFIDQNEEELDQYFYHPDLPMAIGIGSSSWISDVSGGAYQHMQYLPFGELRSNLELLFNKKQEGEKYFIQQKASGNYSTRFTFSGKEKDGETGYSYFGTRYYNSDISNTSN